MLLTYFRYRFRKFVLFLFALQLVVMLVLIAYYQVQIYFQQQERQFVVDLFNAQPQWEDISIDNHTSARLDWMYRMSEIESRNLEFLEKALELRTSTNRFIEEIEAAFVSKKLHELSFKSENIVADYYDLVLEFLESAQIDTTDRRILQKACLSIFPLSDNLLLKQQYKDLKDRDTYRAYFEKIKSDIRYIENLWIDYLGFKMRGRCLSFPYRILINAAYRFEQGDTLCLKASFAERIYGKRKVVIENDTLLTNEYGIVKYRKNAHTIGTHQIKGQILQKDGWGRTTAYPFTHEYTVLPKCN